MTIRRILFIAGLIAILLTIEVTRVHRSQQQLVRARFHELASAIVSGDTNTAARMSIGTQSWSYIDAIIGPYPPRGTTNRIEPTILILGSDASVWLHGGHHRGFPIGDRLDFTKINGTWLLCGGQLD